tara:strand:- start:259 stop:564 length:306 start_codon:yes stop_codon:yes gene_type:complete
MERRKLMLNSKRLSHKTKDTFQDRLIEMLLSNNRQDKKFLKHFLYQYLNCLNHDEIGVFFQQYLNAHDGSLDINKDFYKPKDLIKRVNNKLVPLQERKTNA